MATEKVVYVVVAPEEPEEIEEPTEVEIMEVLAIKKYANYVVSGKNVFGINGSSLEPVEFTNTDGGKLTPSEFFVSGGKIYFSIQTFEQDEEGNTKEVMIYLSQDGETISVVASLPDKPESGRVENESSPFCVKKTSYGDIETSTVMRDTLQEAYVCIDGAVKVDGGFWFSVPETYQTRYEGVYFWPLTSTKSRVKSSGRIW